MSPAKQAESNNIAATMRRLEPRRFDIGLTCCRSRTPAATACGGFSRAFDRLGSCSGAVTAARLYAWRLFIFSYYGELQFDLFFIHHSLHLDWATNISAALAFDGGPKF